MASLTITLAKGTEAGATLRQFAKAIEHCAAGLPDANPTGSSTTLVIDNAPATGTASFQITGGPITSNLFTV